MFEKLKKFKIRYLVVLTVVLGVVLTVGFVFLFTELVFAAPAPLANTPWPTLGQNQKRTYQSPNPGPTIKPDTGSVTSLDIGGATGFGNQAPVIGTDGTIYAVGDRVTFPVGSDGFRVNLIAFDPNTLIRKWSTPLYPNPGMSDAALFAVGGLVVANNGTQDIIYVWVKTYDISTQTPYANQIWAIEQNGTRHSLYGATTGNPGPYNQTIVVGADGKLFFYDRTSDTTLYIRAILPQADLNGAILIWSYSGGTAPSNEAFASGSLSLADNFKGCGLTLLYSKYNRTADGTQRYDNLDGVTVSGSSCGTSFQTGYSSDNDGSVNDKTITVYSNTLIRWPTRWSCSASSGGYSHLIDFTQNPTTCGGAGWTQSSDPTTVYDKTTVGSTGSYRVSSTGLLSGPWTGGDYDLGTGKPGYTIISSNKILWITSGSKLFRVKEGKDFSLSAQTPITAYPTDTKTSTITVDFINGYNKKVNLSIPAKPACVAIISLAPDNVKNPPDPGISTLTIDTINCAVGNHTITVKGDDPSGNPSHSFNINLTVQVNKTGNTYGYAWGENTGWIRFSCKDKSAGGIGGQPQTGDKCAAQGGTDYGVLTTDDALYGYAWGENIGWVSINCDQTLVGGGNTCGSVSYGVVNDGLGNLSDYAWSENIGWISFKDTINPSPLYQVKINETGVFSGYAWSETAGYVSFNSAGPPEYYVQTEWLGTNTPPQMPEPSSPPNKSDPGWNSVSFFLNELEWISGDENLDELDFEIYFSPIKDDVSDLSAFLDTFTTGEKRDTDTTFTYTANLNLETDTSYYWRVSAFDGTVFVFSPVWEFKTVKDEPDIRTSEDADYELNFGTVKIGATKTMYVVVCNFPVKNKKLTTSNISLIGGANGFSLGLDIYYVDKDGDTTTGSILSVNDLAGIENDGGNDGKCASSVSDQPSYNIMVKFSPGAVAMINDTLNIESDDPESNYQITLKGVGEEIASPAPTAPSGGVKIRR